ncbi:hypothetical protein BG46_01330 [Brucella anthropi]|uniref:hypothetical protein n=1 Tax=Brucella anthropi TaxID=529 RepID=UPI00044DCE5F|nr:hypothetical protein [Brucella anthropi]EXL08570.1 hypothetical protein BG46_01330 [Brucella anthropi]
MQIEIKGKPPVDVKNAILVVEGVTRSLCESTGRDPAEGLMMLLTAAAHMGNLYLAGTVREKQAAIASALGSAIVAADDFFRLRDTPGIPANLNSVVTQQPEHVASDHFACACTKTQQDETCPVGYPSLLCEVCHGKGVVQLKDAHSDLERFWRPISEADRSITFEQTFNVGEGETMTIRNSDQYWVRDDDGRIYEATWSDDKGGYWWDITGESPVDPIQFMPHPLSLCAEGQ